MRYCDHVALPRSLRIVRDQRSIAESLSQPTPEPVPHVREAYANPSLLSILSASKGQGVTASVALQVPAFARALQVYTHTIAAFSLKEYVGEDQVVSRAFLQQPSKKTTYTAVMTRTVSDLLLYDEAYWYITERSWDGFPSSISYMPYSQITFVPTNPYEPIPIYGTLYWNGVQVPEADVIRFDGDGNGGWLAYGSSAISTAAALEQAAFQYAVSPLPQIALKNTGADLPESVVDSLLDAWEEARQNRSTAYLNSTISADTFGWNARDLQLVEGRNASATMIARLCNLDPVWVGAGVSGSSLTYSNRTDLYRQLLDLSLTPVMKMIEDRLSMNDVTPRGHEVDFDTTEFLKSNPLEMAQIVQTLLPLNVIDIREARNMIDLPDVMNLPNQGPQ